MSFEYRAARGATSLANDFYDLMFQGTDMISGFWQPFFKSAGRFQLEMAQLTAKQTRAAMELGHHLTSASGTEDISAAYRTYWGNVHASYEAAARNIGTALVRAAPRGVVLEMPSAPRFKPHDTLEIELPRPIEYDRKAA